MENSPAVLFIISHEGFNTLEAAHIFHKLMERLGFTEFYVQGGDWGVFITNNMAQMKPECVCGLHLNMVIDRQPGLAAYILEKFSSRTDLGNTDFEDGGLKRTSVYVPSAFPDELLPCAGAWLGSWFTDVRSFTYMPRGGHFTAFEEPQLMAQDIIQFVEKVESKSHN